jgi:hypothetical protein
VAHTPAKEGHTFALSAWRKTSVLHFAVVQQSSCCGYEGASNAAHVAAYVTKFAVELGRSAGLIINECDGTSDIRVALAERALLGYGAVDRNTW